MPRFETFEGTDREASDYVVAKALNRRNLKPTARVLLALRCVTDRTNADHLAALAGVGRTLAERGLTIWRRADPDLMNRLYRGEVSLTRAYHHVMGRVSREELVPRKRGHAKLKVVAGTDAGMRAAG